MTVIKLNGKQHETAATTVAELARELNLPEAGIAIARNGEVVRRRDHDTTPVREGDAIEFIQAVQGG